MISQHLDALAFSLDLRDPPGLLCGLDAAANELLALDLKAAKNVAHGWGPAQLFLMDAMGQTHGDPNTVLTWDHVYGWMRGFSPRLPFVTPLSPFWFVAAASEARAFFDMGGADPARFKKEGGLDPWSAVSPKPQAGMDLGVLNTP